MLMTYFAILLSGLLYHQKNLGIILTFKLHYLPSSVVFFTSFQLSRHDISIANQCIGSIFSIIENRSVAFCSACCLRSNPVDVD